MKANHSSQILAAVGQLQHGCPTETVADSREPPAVHQWMLAQNIQSNPRSSLPVLDVFADLSGPLSRLFRMLSDLVLTVHIERESNVSQLGQLFSTITGVVIQSPLFVYNEHAWPFLSDTIVSQAM